MDDFWDDLLSSWWGKLLMAAVFFLIAWAAYAFFARLENTGEGGRVPWYIALLYYVGGKWVVVVPMTLIGMLIAWSGIQQLRSGEE